MTIEDAVISVEKLRPQQGECLLFKLDHKPSAVDCEKMGQLVQRFSVGVNVIVLGPGEDISTITVEQLNAVGYIKAPVPKIPPELFEK